MYTIISIGVYPIVSKKEIIAPDDVPIYVLIFLARSPRAPGDPGRHPKAIRWGFGDFPGPPGGPRHPPRPKPTKK